MNTANSMNRDALAIGGNQLDLLRVKLLLQHSTTAILTNTILSIITAVLIYPNNNHFFVFMWIAAAMAVSIARLALARYLKLRVENEYLQLDYRFYENLYAGCSLASGMVWGTLGWQVDGNIPFMQQISVPLMMVGMSAGAVFSHMSSIKTLRAFDIPLIVPLVVTLIMHGFYLEASAVAVYLVSILILSEQVYANVNESLGLRFENDELLAEMNQFASQQSLLLQQLKEKEDFLSHSFEEAGVPMLLITPNFRILDANKAASRLFDCSREDLLSSSVMTLLHHDESKELELLFNPVKLGQSKQTQFTCHFASMSGHSLWLSSVLSAVYDDENLSYFVMQSQDITKEYALIEDLHYQSHHDALTGLPNRLAMEEYIRNLLQKEFNTQHVFCYLDLDLFKIVNESSGHQVGDELLVQFSNKLKNIIHEHDFLARFSGDEFAFLMTNCSLTKAIDCLNQLLEDIRHFTFEHNNQHFKVTTSVGVVPIDGDKSWTDILKQADSACFAAKESGRDRIHIYSEDDEQLVQRSGEIHWVTRIQHALEQDRLVLFSQLIAPINEEDNVVPHCELLIRMLDEDGNIISPGHFLPAAERYNLAASIDLWTVEHVVTRLRQAVEAGKAIQGVYAVNLSGQSLGDSRFYERIIEKIQAFDLSKYGVQLCFEVTETAAITNIRAALQFIEELRKVGVQFALDDFGSGLSSFAYLKQLPIDYLKIDGMFVKDCLHNRVNMEIINSINGIGHVMGLKTIVEFVEDKETLAAMKLLGIDYAQGFYLAKPEQWQL